MTELLAQLPSADAPNIAIRWLAVLGAAVVSGLLVGMLASTVTRSLTTRALPPWGLRIVRIGGGGVGGWLMALLLMGGGGGGLGGSGGLGFSSGKDKVDGTKEKAKTTEEVKPPPQKDQQARNPDVVSVAVLGTQPLSAIVGDKTLDDTLSYRFEGGPLGEVLTLEQTQKRLLERRRQHKELKVVIVLYQNSPAKGTPYVKALEQWLIDEKLSNSIVIESSPAPIPQVGK